MYGMKKQLTEKIVYEPNKRVKVTVQNKPRFDDSGATSYERKVTVTVDCGISDEKVNFASDEEISKFLENVDVEDPQQSMFGDEEEN